MFGTVDRYEGAGRSSYEKCRWWKMQKSFDNYTGRERLERFCHESEPAGVFYAEMVEAPAEMMSASGDTRYTRYTVTVSTTNDIVGKLHKGDYVEYQGRIWRVESMSTQPIWQRSALNRRSTSGNKILVLIC